MELEFKKFDKNTEIKKQRELFIDCFPENIGTAVIEERHYNWKFHTFPDKITSYEYVTYSGNDMVGYYAAIPYRYRIGKKATNVAMVCDVMTSSKQRGKGIFTKLGDYATNELKKESLPFTTGYPIRKEVIPGHLKVGWKIAFELPLYMKFLKINGVFKKKRLDFLSGIINPFLNIYHWITTLNFKDKSSYTVNHYNSINDIEDIEGFTKEWSKQISNVLIKDKEFLNWRFNAPERKYEFFVVRKNKAIVGFIAARKIIKEEIPSLAIMDWMVINNENKANKLLNIALNNFSKENKIEAILTMISKYNASKLNLLCKGFFKSPFKFYLIIKNLTQEFSDDILMNEKNWHLMWIDSDDL